jgi:hypothetical protein
MARGDSLGFDVWIGPTPAGVDMARNGRTATGPELAANEMMARCLADTIPCIDAEGGVLDFGKDLRALVGAAMDQGDAESLGAQMGIIFNRSPRLDPGATRVSVLLTPAGATYDFILDADARTAADGIPINLRLGINALTVARLAQGGS